jgi:hypothetical protein
MRRVVATSLLVAALAGACSKGAGTTVTAGSGAGSSPTAVRTDHAAAERVVLQASDVPGYDALPVLDPQPSSVKGASGFENCAGAAAALGDPQRSVLSPAFLKGQTTAVSSLVIVAPTETEAQAAMASLGRADTAGCLTSLFRTVLDLDQLPGTTAKTEAQPTPKVSDQSVMWRTTVLVVTGGQTIPAYADLTFFRSGRTVGSLFNFQLGEPFPAAERTKLLNAMVARV